MSKVLAVFSGQGSQYPGMGKELFDEFKKVREVYECAGDILGMDIAKISFEGEQTELSKTEIAQPAIFTLSVAAYTAALDFMPKPDALAGHSLGEIAAMYAAGSFSLEDGFKLIKVRAQAMDKQYGDKKGAMVAIMKSDIDTINEVCESVDGLVVPVNLNTPEQTVISGEEPAVVKAAELLEAQGARTVRLNVSNGFHTELMQPAAESFVQQIQDIELNRMQLPFYSNLTGGLFDVENYHEYFQKHMVSPVLFTDEVTAMSSDGVEKAIEFGPNKVVSNLIRRNNRKISVTNVENLKGMKALEGFVK